jgi:hypothetical protein
MRRRTTTGWLESLGFPVLVTKSCPPGRVYFVGRDPLTGEVDRKHSGVLVMETQTATSRLGRLDQTAAQAKKGCKTKGSKGGKGTKQPRGGSVKASGY